jgi:protein transport protein SEC20
MRPSALERNSRGNVTNPYTAFSLCILKLSYSGLFNLLTKAQSLYSCRPLLRKAQIQAQDNLKQAQKRERELLWASFSQPRSSKTSGRTSPTAADNNNNHHYRPRARAKTARSEMSKDDQTVASSSDVTAALRRTHDMMASELSRSDFARRTLQESTQALAQLGESYSSLDAMLASSRDLLGTLLTSQKSDTWYLQTSFYMLAATNCWLVFRRLLYGPLWWLVWLPLRLLFRGTVAVTSLAGGSGSGQDEVIAAVPLEGKIEASMNNEGIHTVQVGGQPQMAAPEEEEMVVDPGNDESMVEEIGRMIDEAREGKQEVVMDEQVMYEAMEAQEFAQEAEPIEQEAERVRVEL